MTPARSAQSEDLWEDFWGGHKNILLVLFVAAAAMIGTVAAIAVRQSGMDDCKWVLA